MNKLNTNSIWIVMCLLPLMIGCTNNALPHEHGLAIKHTHSQAGLPSGHGHDKSGYQLNRSDASDTTSNDPNDELGSLLPEYLISPGDKIDLTYHFGVVQQDAYYIAIGDQIRVEFFYYPQLDRTLNVRPDGKVTLPNVGDVNAVGLTPMALSDQIAKVYAKQLREPRATVSLIRYGERKREFKDTVSTSQRGQSRLLLVEPDGNVSAPMLPSTLVAGLTVSEAESVINELYVNLVPGMTTTVALGEETGNKVYVYGEVKKPGYYELSGAVSVTQVIALAGGFDTHADLNNILLISRDAERNARGRIINLKSTLSKAGVTNQAILRQADVVYVSRTGFGKAITIGDGLKKMIPINFGVFYNLAEKD